MSKHVDPQMALEQDRRRLIAGAEAELGEARRRLDDLVTRVGREVVGLRVSAPGAVPSLFVPLCDQVIALEGEIAALKQEIDEMKLLLAPASAVPGPPVVVAGPLTPVPVAVVAPVAAPAPAVPVAVAAPAAVPIPAPPAVVAPAQAPPPAQIPPPIPRAIGQLPASGPGGFCPNCGKPINAGVRFCNHCAFKL